LSTVFLELQRRNVPRVAALYVVSAWLIARVTRWSFLKLDTALASLHAEPAFVVLLDKQRAKEAFARERARAGEARGDIVLPP
jgi:hypothetical protein